MLRIIFKTEVFVKNSIFIVTFCMFLMGCHSHSDTDRDTAKPVLTAPAALTVAAVDALGTPATDAV